MDVVMIVVRMDYRYGPCLWGREHHNAVSYGPCLCYLWLLMVIINIVLVIIVITRRHHNHNYVRNAFGSRVYLLS